MFGIKIGNNINMIVYEFYWEDEKGGEHLLGILPERRKKPERITEESVLKWGEMIKGNHLNSQKIYFVKIELDN